MNQIYSCSDFRSSLWSLAHTLGELHVRSHVAFLFTSHMIFQVHLKILEHVKVLTNTKGPSINSMVTLCDMFYDNQSSQIIDDVDNERNVHADLCCSYVLLFMLVICPPCLIYIYDTHRWQFYLDGYSRQTYCVCILRKFYLYTDYMYHLSI